MNRKILPVFIIPLLSCMFSSVVGVILGQIGNQIYKVLGQAANCLSIPAFIGLFFLTFGLSFFSNKLLRKLFTKSGK